jgi:hypothetical protein
VAWTFLLRALRARFARARPDADADLATLERRRARLRTALAHAEIDWSSLKHLRASGRLPASGARLARAAALAAVRLLAGAAVGAGVAFLVARTVVHGGLP